MARDPDDIFDAGFLRTLEGLRMIARRVPAGGRMAEQRSRARGGGVEFTDVRPYVAGDDIRAIDWHLLGRFDRVFVRLFLQDEDLPVYVLLDLSRSMRMPPAGREAPADKLTAALQATAALAHIAIHHLDRVQVLPFGNRAADPLPPLAGKAAFQKLLSWLAALEADGDTDIVDAIHALGARRRRRGLCIVVSDFLDPAGPAAVVDALQGLDHALCLVQVAHRGEARPALRGELEVEDCESGERLAVHVDDALLDRYERAYRDFQDTLRAVAEGRGGSLLTLLTDEPVAPQLAALFPEGTLHA